jgi:hypothetical protein
VVPPRVSAGDLFAADFGDLGSLEVKLD